MTITQMQISPTEQNQREVSIRASGSVAPINYYPIKPELDCVTFVGHDAQYGSDRRWGFGIRAIIQHTTEGSLFTNSMRYNARRPEKVSSHFHVGQAGEIGQGVPMARRSWTTARWNDEVLNNEIVGRAADTDAQWRSRDAQLEAIIELTTEQCRVYSIPAVWLTPTEFAWGASRQSTSPYQMGTVLGIIDHDGANKAAIMLGGSTLTYSHHDVGPALRSILRHEIVPEVARRLASTNPPEDEMRTIEPYRSYDSRDTNGILLPGDTRTVPVGYCTEAFIVIGTDAPQGPGFFSVNDPAGKTNVVGYGPNIPNNQTGVPVLTPNGHITVTANVSAAHFTIDVFQIQPLA